ncbi:MAG: hypothetical protein WCH34_06300, partial [Bacteroidota bacterium]
HAADSLWHAADRRKNAADRKKSFTDSRKNSPLRIRYSFPAGDLICMKSKSGIDAYLFSTPGGTDCTKVSTTAKHEITFDVAQFHESDY